MKYLTEETIKQIFFQSDRPRPDALLADEVDIVQFANNLIAYAHPHLAKAEHKRCVGIVRAMNPEVATALGSQRPEPV
jgi:hypothetical protein